MAIQLEFSALNTEQEDESPLLKLFPAGTQFQEKMNYCKWCEHSYPESEGRLQNDRSKNKDTPKDKRLVRSSPCRRCELVISKLGSMYTGAAHYELLDKLKCTRLGCKMEPTAYMLEFDHYDPVGKKSEKNKKELETGFTYTRSGYTLRTFKEVLKCSVLCASHHTELSKYDLLNATGTTGEYLERVKSIGGGGEYKIQNYFTMSELKKEHGLLPEIPEHGFKIDRKIHLENLGHITNHILTFTPPSMSISNWDRGEDPMNRIKWRVKDIHADANTNAASGAWYHREEKMKEIKLIIDEFFAEVDERLTDDFV